MKYRMHKEFSGKGKIIWRDPETYEDLSNYLRNFINEPVEKVGSTIRGSNTSVEVEVSFHPTLSALIKREGNTVMRVKITPHELDVFCEKYAVQLLSHLARFEPRYIKYLRHGDERDEELLYGFHQLDPFRHIA